MAIIKCKMCGGDIELSADKTFGTCDSCGSTMTLPKVDDEQRAAAFNRGNHFRRIGEFDKALAVYERIVNEDNTDSEAHWCCALCRFGIEYVEDPATYEWLPTCHRASFDSFLEDVDYLAALEHSDGVTKRQYQKDAAKIAEVQRGILATSQNAEPFDVFICYKESDENGNRTRDSLLAQDIYYQLTDQGRKVFFSMITLENVPGVQYEPYIFAALNSAKVMVVVGTKPEYLNAVWVKNEWSRFLALMKKDRHKLLLPCYRDMDPYDMPEALSVLQSYDMGKIGFIQDLTRGIAKVLDADKPKQAPVAETVVVQSSGGNVGALLKRGNMALEDGLWTKAEEFFEEVLNQNAECAEAYLGIALLMEQCANLQALVEKRLRITQNISNPEKRKILFDNNHAQQMAEELYLPGFLEMTQIQRFYENFDCTYLSYVSGRTAQKNAEETLWQENKNLARAFRFASGDTAKALADAKAAVMAKLTERIERAKESDEASKKALQERMKVFLELTDEKARKAHAEAKKARHEKYENCKLTLEDIDHPPTLRSIAKTLQQMQGYLDSEELAKQCMEKADRQQAELDRIAEEKRIADEAARAAKAKADAEAAAAKAKADAEAAAKRKKTGIIIGIIVAIVAVIGIVAAIVISGMQKKAAYSDAMALYEQGQYEEAVAAFQNLGDYEDSQQKIIEVRFAQVESCYQQGDYEKAVELLDDLNNFADTSEMESQIASKKEEVQQQEKYAAAEELLALGYFTRAAEKFADLGDYSNSAEMVTESHYQAMVALAELYTQYDLQDVYAGLDGYAYICLVASEARYEALNLEGFQDALKAAFPEDASIDPQVDLQEAVSNPDYGLVPLYDFIETRFAELGDYKDAATYTENIDANYYEQGLQYMQNDDYENAIEFFILAGDYSDSKQQLIACFDAYFGEGLYDQISNAKVGDTLTFGTYEQDNNTSNGQEDIEWIVLRTDDTSALLISKYILDAKTFSDYGKSNWSSATLHSWLSKDFYNQAFSESDKLALGYMAQALNSHVVEAPITLLSGDELREYAAVVDMKAEPTAYAKANVGDSDFSGADDDDVSKWWLRSPGANQWWAEAVSADAYLDSGNVEVYHGVRPVILIDLTQND